MSALATLKSPRAAVNERYLKDLSITRARRKGITRTVARNTLHQSPST